MTLDEVLGDPTKSKFSAPKIGELLIQRGQIRRYQLDFLLGVQLDYQRLSRDIKIGELLVEHRALSEKTLNDILLWQMNMPKESVTDVLRELLDDETFQTKLITAD